MVRPSWSSLAPDETRLAHPVGTKAQLALDLLRFTTGRREDAPILGPQHIKKTLDPAQRDGLLQSWITTRSDLNGAEEENIVKGGVWWSRGAKAMTC